MEKGVGASRRDALKLAGAAGALALLPLEGIQQAFAAPPDMAGLPWANRDMRWMQVAFTEDNPADYDPKFWFDLFERT